MSEVNPISGTAGAPLSSAVQRAHLDAASATQAAGGTGAAQGAGRTHIQDRVEFSDHARHLERLRQMPDVRESKVQAARNAIAEGAFETPDRLRAALLRLLEDIDPA